MRSCPGCLQVCAAQPQHPTTTLQKALSRLAPTCHKLWSAFDWIAEQVMLVSLPAVRYSNSFKRSLCSRFSLVTLSLAQHLHEGGRPVCPLCSHAPHSLFGAADCRPPQ